MNSHMAYVITGSLALLFWIFAFIGVITIIRIILKSTHNVYKNLKKLFKTSTKELSIPKYDDYYQSTYYLTTKNRYENVIQDKGLHGEYKIFLMLRTYENYDGRFLFNCYLPREHNETTEVDVILLTHDGIFVIESKNYDGWIYGSENQELWTQTLAAGNKVHKTHFYNPIRQNRTHIKYLKRIIGDKLPIYSIVIFSNECTLKNIEVADPATKVIYLGRAIRAVSDLSARTPNAISQESLVSIYNKLYPYTQVSECVKQEHIKNINEKTKM